jgi:hypothetical protein
MPTKICPKCQNTHIKPGIFCSRSCANSRGPRSDDFKQKVSDKLKGTHYQTEDAIRKRITSRGYTVRFDKPNLVCKVCNTDTLSKYKKTCSKECYDLLNKSKSQQHPNCGGQKHTHRSKIVNIKNEVFTAESSYEVRLSTILNELDIYWVRPSFMWYVDDKLQKRRYYPDFFLPQFNVYLDPKNEYLIKTDIQKIIKVSDQNKLNIVVIGDRHINAASIHHLIYNMFSDTTGVLLYY